MAEAAVNTAPIKWAQRSDSLYITIALPGKFVLSLGLSLAYLTDLSMKLTTHVCACASALLYIILFIIDVKDETINLSDTELTFKGKSEDKDYEVNIEFFKPVDSKGSTYKVLPRSVQMVVMKATKNDTDEADEEFWPRLLKDKTLEKNQVKIDWDRYADEDEEEEAGGFDMSALEGGMGMGGMGGMGGMDMDEMVRGPRKEKCFVERECFARFLTSPY